MTYIRKVLGLFALRLAELEVWFRRRIGRFGRYPVRLSSSLMPEGFLCLDMVCEYYDAQFNYKEKINFKLNNLGGISRIANQLGFATEGFMMQWSDLTKVHLPCIARVLDPVQKAAWFVVVWKIDRRNRVTLTDTRFGLLTVPKENFLRVWTGGGPNAGTVLTFRSQGSS